MRCTISVLAISLFAFCTALQAGGREDDPIKTKLDTAKTKYETEMKKFHDAVKESFDKRDDAARKAGKLQLVEQIKAEREQFEKKGHLTTAAPPQLRKMPVTITNALDEAYNTAVKEYTKAKKDDLAAALIKDWKEQRSSGKVPWAWSYIFPPGRYDITYDQKVMATTEIKIDGTFTRVKDKVEYKGTIDYIGDRLILRNADFVEAWAPTATFIAVTHWFPAATFPNGKAQAIGQGVFAKE